MYREGGCTVVRQGHLIAVVGTFLIGCAVLLLAVGCAGVGSEARHKEQTHSPQATASEEARCEGTRTLHHYVVAYGRGLYSKERSGSEEDMKKADKKAGQKVEDFGVHTTNDLPGCPKGGQLLGTDKPEWLDGLDGDDEMRGLGGSDHELVGGPGSDIIYGGAGGDYLTAGKGEDVMYGGDGNDLLSNYDEQRDKIYCGEGRDEYIAGKNDYVDSNCEKEDPGG